MKWSQSVYFDTGSPEYASNAKLIRFGPLFHENPVFLICFLFLKKFLSWPQMAKNGQIRVFLPPPPPHRIFTSESPST